MQTGQETIEQIQDAIKRKLYVFVKTPIKKTPLDTDLYLLPVEVSGDTIRLVDRSSGDWYHDWTIEQWKEHVSDTGQGLYRKTGVWDFTEADNPAFDLIKFCTRNPESAGNRIYYLEKEVADLKKQLMDIEK